MTGKIDDSKTQREKCLFGKVAINVKPVIVMTIFVLNDLT